MKNLKKFLGILLAAILTFSFAVPAQAVEEYTYKIRVFAGKQGLVGGSASVEKSGIVNGSVTFRQALVGDSNAGYISIAGQESAITLPQDSKYYVKGIKISGSETMANSSTAIDKDMDYVVVYGIKGEQVVYTVRYLDEDGNKLYEDERYTGNIGDKPIVAYRYFEGYVPNANNLTKTLSRNEAENIFTFYYSRVATGEGGEGGGGETIITEDVITGTNTAPIVVAGAGADAAVDVGGDGGVAVIPGAADAAGEDGAGAEVPVVDIPEELVPQDLVDLDDEDVPLANTDLSGEDEGRSEPGSLFVNMPPAAIVGIVSAVVLVVALAWYLLFKRKKKDTDKTEKER